ncbi:MAG: nitrilase-related carbon-nitrogen hydrolase, partial [Marmoricola sp.]
LAANRAAAVEAIRQASAGGAELVLLPENGLMLGTGDQMRAAAFDEDGPAIRELAAAAAAEDIVVVLGGMKNSTAQGVYNSALVIGRDGGIAGRYDKIHLFDARIDGASFEASSREHSGSTPTLLRAGDITYGLTICYDVRFPELYRRLALAGADVLLVPSAFTEITGRAHWETLLRARAIENGCYVIASATIHGADRTGDAFATYGHALAVSPWGEVIADLGETSHGVAIIEIDPGAVDTARASLPVLQQVRNDAYVREPHSICLS